MSHSLFLLGANRLSGYVFVRPLKDKSWTSLRPILVEMLTQDPGFARVDVLYSDGESALSDENVRQLQGLVPRLRKVVRYKPQQVNSVPKILE